MEVESLLVKLLGAEDLQRASYSDGSLFFRFSNSDNSFNALNGSCAKVYLSKEQKHIKKKRKKLPKNKFDPVKSVHYIKRENMQTLFSK